ncbi:MAG: hypothetical protein HXM94_00180 [Parvimonas micra]|uniref:Uncharacterized protein n=1 Tax=Parvimonas micra TaxID=33033 RepID=A0A930H4G7_9FIRM|nr:hypothetical protein [Parvimonas micra]MBF1306204.1 hypothetical protein [Parvimonas micra]
MVMQANTTIKNNEDRNTVIFITSQGQVATYLTDLFTNPNLPLHKDYYVLGTSPNRESGIAFCEKERPKLVVFFETTAGTTSISETVYRIRLTGARVLFVSSARMIGDLVLESLVYYGVYDLILDEVIDPEKFLNYVYHPRTFPDVSIFIRMLKVPDSGAGGKAFELPDLERIRQFSMRLEDDYLTDSVGRAVQGMNNRVDQTEENRSITSRLFSAQPNNSPQQKRVQQAPQQRPIQQQSNFGVGDIDINF